MTRTQMLTDEQWALIEPLLPSSRGRVGRNFRNTRRVVEGMIYRYRTGIAWRDLPAEFGPWQTVWKRHARFTRDGIWDAVLTELLAQADAAGELDWAVSVDSTIVRAHQHSATAKRTGEDDLENTARLPARTRGPGELQESA